MHLTRRDFLLRLNLIPGVGRKSALACWRWLEATDISVMTSATVAQMLKEVPLPATTLAKVGTGLTAPAVVQRADLNLAHSRCLTLADEQYPLPLREIYEPPVVLYYQGVVDRLTTPLLGVVGSRHPTDYAIRAMRVLLPPVVRQGVTIVSGLAQGVDTLGHQVALAHRGGTIAVLGTGLGRCYPAANRTLMAELSRTQLVVSEYPWATGPAKFQFVERNRVISGLVNSVLVVEAAGRSGSLITANFALQENRNVLAVPGPIDAPNSLGTNELIFAGAKPILNSEHIIEEVLVDKRL